MLRVYGRLGVNNMAKRHISVTDDRVLKALAESKNASRFIEEAVLYYLDSIEKEYVTREQVKSIIMDCLGSGLEIKNGNYSAPDDDDINAVLNL